MVQQKEPVVCGFISKLWNLVGNEGHADLIGWSSGGQSVIIHNTHQFSKKLLPRYFRHNHMDSFTRQLNTYGFRNGMDSDCGTGEKRLYGETVFHHPQFRMGQEKLLHLIRRKTPAASHIPVQVPECPSSSDQIALPSHEDRDGLKELMERQESLQHFLVDMEKENTAVWQEIALLRHRTAKQKSIAQQLYHFLIPEKGTSRPRKRNVSLIESDLCPGKRFRTKESQKSMESDFSCLTSMYETEVSVPPPVEEVIVSSDDCLSKSGLPPSPSMEPECALLVSDSDLNAEDISGLGRHLVTRSRNPLLSQTADSFKSGPPSHLPLTGIFW